MNRTGHTIQQRVGPRRGERQRELQQRGEQQASADSPRGGGECRGIGPNLPLPERNVRFPLRTL
jgi:hypothetical protein